MPPRSSCRPSSRLGDSKTPYSRSALKVARPVRSLYTCCTEWCWQVAPASWQPLGRLRQSASATRAVWVMQACCHSACSALRVLLCRRRQVPNSRGNRVRQMHSRHLQRTTDASYRARATSGERGRPRASNRREWPPPASGSPRSLASHVGHIGGTGGRRPSNAPSRGGTGGGARAGTFARSRPAQAR